MPGEDFHLSDLARFQAHPRTLSACGCVGVAVTPGIASLNPGLMSSQPFRAAGLHAGGVKEISPR